MGLITKEVHIGLTGSNQQYYKDKGYKIPKAKNKWGRVGTPRGSSINVKTDDLPKGSHIKVEVKCDCCGKILLIKWQDYKKCVHNNGNYFCKACASKLYVGDRIKEGKLKNSYTFEEWCYLNHKVDILKLWNNELNKCKPSEITFSPVKKYYFNCPRNIHNPELKNIGSFTSGRDGAMDCKQCNSFAQWGIDNLGKDFLTRYWSNKNTVNPWKILKGSKIKVIINCIEKNYHDEYEISCNHFISGARCPYCNRTTGKLHPLDSLGKLRPEVLKIWGEGNKKTPLDYAPFSKKKVWWKCENNNHSDYVRSVNTSNKCNFRCPECSKERAESFLQEKVRLYLESLNHIIKHEYNCTLRCVNPKTNCQMPYDNEIVDLKLVIEVHGSQHYSTSNGYFGDDFDLHKRRIYDRYKRMYAKSQGYFYLEIPYWKDDDKETYKKLIDNKIKEVKELKQINKLQNIYKEVI